MPIRIIDSRTGRVLHEIKKVSYLGVASELEYALKGMRVVEVRAWRK